VIDRIVFIICLILISPVMMYGSEPIINSNLIRIHNTGSAVDIKDILDRNSNKLLESDVKKICAEITDRYHDLGYTAFYIKRALLNKDGTADLYFNESVVVDVIVTGMSQREMDISSSLFTKGEMFNEYTLKKNVSAAKKKYNLKQLNVTIRRGEGEQIVLAAHAVERFNEIETGAFNSPIYGILPEVKYRINYGGILAGISASSSFNQTDRSLTRGSVFFNSDNIPGNCYFTLFADISERKDSFADNDELIYKHRSLTSGTGFCIFNGAAGMKLFLKGTIDELTDYPKCNGGVSFSGIQLKLNYNDSSYKIDYDDIISGEIDYSSGWNFIEERPSSKLILTYLVNFPLYSGFFFSLNGNFFYTSDEERFSHFYVYDQFFPCKDKDFSSASWRNIAGADIAYELMKRTMYMSPQFKWGFHNAEDSNNNVCAAGVKFLFTAENVRMEISWLYDINEKIRDGFVMFSVSAGYL